MTVPRTQEFGGLQQQAVQRPVTEQNMLALQAAKQTEGLRTPITSAQHISNRGMREKPQGDQGNALQKKARKRKPDQAAEDNIAADSPAHPYKGHHLDIRL